MSPMLITILLGVAVMLVLAVAMGWILGWANVAFHVDVDPKVAELTDTLPGANCGACGFAGCAEYASHLADGSAQPGACTQANAEINAAIAQILGVAAAETHPHKAVVHCAAHWEQRLGSHNYAGEPSCAAAHLITGTQGCVYGCLGQGDCAAVCPHDAIHVIDGLATVDYAKCVGCRKCEAVCPRHLIQVIPFKTTRTVVVACANPDFGPDVKAVCTIGCIGCTACSRNNEAFKMEKNLPVLDYETFEGNAPEHVITVEKCPSGILLFLDDEEPDDHITDVVQAPTE